MQLTSCYLFEGLPQTQLNQLAAIQQQIQFKKDQWFFNEGDPAVRLYVIKTGAVELLTTINATVELPITIIRQTGSCFGTAGLVAPYHYSLSARGVEAGTLFFLERTEFQQLIEQDAVLGRIVFTNLARHFLERLKETRQELKIHFKTLFSSVRS